MLLQTLTLAGKVDDLLDPALALHVASVLQRFHCFSASQLPRNQQQRTVLFGLCILLQSEIAALPSSLESFQLGTVFVVCCLSSLPRFSCIVKCVSFMVLLQFYRGSPAKILSHTPKMMKSEVLNKGSQAKICKLFIGSLRRHT